MAQKLKALEKNILKYRAFQMILLLHKMESLREFVVGSIRSTDRFKDSKSGETKELPEGTKQAFKKALKLLVSKQMITEKESLDIQEINNIRNTIGHEIHNLVLDISYRYGPPFSEKKYDYHALERLDKYKEKIRSAMGKKYILLATLREAFFDEAEKSYNEELSKLKRKIDRQYKERYGNANNESAARDASHP